MALRHPAGGGGGGRSTPSSRSSSSGGGGGSGSERRGDSVPDEMLPYRLEREKRSIAAGAAGGSSSSSGLGGVPESDLPYVSTVRLVADSGVDVEPTPATRFPSRPADSPNFFDILFENDCLPYRKDCHRCLKDASNEAHEVVYDADGNVASSEPAAHNACSKCRTECPCYCDILCRVRPPPKPVTRTYSVRPPAYRKEPGRHVPKIVHQTWFEPVTREKYPNMSRLIESWRKSGWEYYFYDDESAEEFLGGHFPPEVLEAYRSITPGELVRRAARRALALS